MKSRYRTTCRECGSTINIGDEIEKRGSNWVHLECPTGNSFESVLASANTPAEVDDSQAHYEEAEVFVPSKYQEDIFEFVRSGEGNAVVEAVAGSGKTTTLVKLLNIVPKDKRTIFLAFNKHIATELRRRAPSHVEVSTIHALGYRLCRYMNSHLTIDEDKVGTIMDAFWPTDRRQSTAVRIANRVKRYTMRKIVSLAKATLFDYKDPRIVLEYTERYGIDVNGEAEDVIGKLPEVMQLCLDNTDTIDFDDMIWFPIKMSELRKHIEPYDFVLVDETQDLNASQIEFILGLCSANGRIIAVGDRHQSLYGFRGADVEAIPRLIEMLNAKVLPLSISYRCPVSIVQAAQAIVPQIEASPTAKQGAIKKIGEGEMLDIVAVGDMVVCRTNAPLIGPAFETIRRGKKAIIRGKDIGKSLVNFIERFQAGDLSALEVSMQEYSIKEYQRLLDKGKELQADIVMDKYETIVVTAEHCVSVEDLIGKLLTLFDDSNQGVVFSSIHRAKGLEAEHVFILHPELMPHPKAKMDWEQEQERNCQYVAVTRSKDILYFVNSQQGAM